MIYDVNGVKPSFFLVAFKDLLVNVWIHIAFKFAICCIPHGQNKS